MKTFIHSLFLLLCFQCNIAIAKSNSDSPKNIILIVADGMGAGAIKAYRMYQDDKKTPQEELLEFDPYLIGNLNTNSLDPRFNITDSAAAATAFATGQKTYNGFLSVDVNKKPIPTVLEKAKKLGMSTGLVATSEITHATPAAFIAHIDDRGKKKKIAQQMFNNQFDNKPMVDLLLGGGKKYFNKELIKKFQEKNYQYLTNRSELLATTKLPLLGLFAKKGLPKFFDRDDTTPTLAEMSQVALEQLSKNKKGFFLVIEGSQIDWAAHDNDIVGVISEMQDFELATKAVLDFAKKDKNTLVIITSDHVTGGLSVGSKSSGQGIYNWNVKRVKSFTSTPRKIIKEAKKSKDLVAEFQKATTYPLTKREQKYLKKINLNHKSEPYLKVSALINFQTYTGWTTLGHTGEDVNLYAFGPQRENLVGYWDNTKIGQFIFQLLENKKQQKK